MPINATCMMPFLSFSSSSSSSSIPTASMSQKNSYKPLIHFFLLLQILAIITFATPLTKPTVLLTNNTTTPPSSMIPHETLPTSQNSNTTMPLPPPKNMFDYRIAGTPLVLRITETGFPVTRIAVNKVIDAGIRRVVARINAGAGRAPIDGGRFGVPSAEIDMRINALPNAQLNWFLLGE